MYIADLHIHSRFSRATSRDLDAPHLDLWARRKGLSLIGTGDFTHPAWREELKEHLIPAEEGFYRLREDLSMPCETEFIAPRFIFSGEISTIYKKNGKTRKVHSLILLPSLEAANLLSQRLEVIGNIRSDGRPILGLDCRDLLEITLEACPEVIFIPAHIWTPHFSVFGAFSGFNSLEECFGDLTPHIHALETGLSSDPPMNHRISALDNYLLVSNSDAHSPAKLGREANVLSCDLSYSALRHALNTGEGFQSTLEFFPEEGKYHLDGHRSCGLCLDPEETKRLNGRCPICGKKLTIGVLNRIETLSNRPAGTNPIKAKPFESLVPLPEIIGACMKCGAESKKVQAAYFDLLKRLGAELDILRSVELSAIEAAAGRAIAEGISRLRAGKVCRKPGYDGEYGKISLFAPGELETLSGQTIMAGLPSSAAEKKHEIKVNSAKSIKSQENLISNPGLNPEQEEAVNSDHSSIAVIAGPGTGKTKTLVERIAHLIEANLAKPEEITALTFTNQAAAEMRERLEKRLDKKAAKSIVIGTFHGVCLRILDKKPLIGSREALEILKSLPGAPSDEASLRRMAEEISLYRNGVTANVVPPLLSAYQDALERLGVRDLDSLLLDALKLDAAVYPCFQHLLVDEFQDINPLQRQLTLNFSRNGKTLFVIGDPDQSIYGFRGANAKCFDDLKNALPELNIITLKENYRSSPEILSAANAVIAHNPGGIRTLRANRSSDTPVRAVLAETPFAESIFIAREIAHMTGGMDMTSARNTETEALSFSDIAVLCRTRRQLEQIEVCLRHDDIPCVISSREDYLNEDSVQGALTFFQSLLYPDNIPALHCALSLIYRCTPEEIALGESMINLISDPIALNASIGFMGALAGWATDVATFSPIVSKSRPRKLLEQWEKIHGGNSAFEKLKAAALFYGDMQEMVENLILGQESDIRRATHRRYASGAVRLMTLHGAKGLEFPAVFLAGASKGALPLERKNTPADIEEERRLFFVGVTRAQRILILSGSDVPSDFFDELPVDIRLERLSCGKKILQGQQLSFL